MWSINEAQTANRQQPIKQLKQSIKGHTFVTKRITRGTQKVANTNNWTITGLGNLLPDGKTCRNGLPKLVLCGDCYDGLSICGEPCQGNTENCNIDLN